VKARAYYGDGTASRVNAHGFAKVEPRPAIEAPGARPGLAVDYFEGTREWRKLPVFDSLTPASSGVVSAIDLRPSPRMEYFGLRFRGFVRVPQTGVYGFQISSDDGSRLIIDGQTIADNDEIHGMGDRMGWVGLAAGLHRFELQYFQGCCGLGLRLTVDSPRGPRGPVPAAWWFHQERQTPQ
jgi:hexosaminidase